MAGADHRDLHRGVQHVERLGRDAGLFVSENSDGASPGGRKVGEADRTIGRFDAENCRAGGALPFQPADGVSADPMHAAAAAQCVAAGKCFRHPREPGSAMQAPTASQVRSSVPRFAPCMGHSRANDQVIPAPVPALPTQAS